MIRPWVDSGMRIDGAALAVLIFPTSCWVAKQGPYDAGLGVEGLIPVCVWSIMTENNRTEEQISGWWAGTLRVDSRVLMNMMSGMMKHSVPSPC